LVLLCCAPSTLTFYGRAFQERRIGKCYLAVVHGRLGTPGGCGQWTHPLSRSAGGRRNAAGAGRRAPCRTLFKVLGHSDHYSLAACFPGTGRRHQIRRHAKLAGHPVVGDRRYGSPRALRYLREQAGLTRLGLHAHGLDLPQAEGAPRLRVLSRGMPAALLALLAADGRQPPAVWAGAVATLARTVDWPESGPFARRGFN
jgi:23S rRNA-/tRNA-specific pseudouridylate synthase